MLTSRLISMVCACWILPFLSCSNCLFARLRWYSIKSTSCGENWLAAFLKRFCKICIYVFKILYFFLNKVHLIEVRCRNLVSNWSTFEDYYDIWKLHTAQLLPNDLYQEIAVLKMCILFAKNPSWTLVEQYQWLMGAAGERQGGSPCRSREPIIAVANALRGTNGSCAPDAPIHLLQYTTLLDWCIENCIRPIFHEP